MQLQLETIINSLEDAVLCLDEAGQVAFLNEAATKLFSCDNSKIMGQPFSACHSLVNRNPSGIPDGPRQGREVRAVREALTGGGDG